MNRIQPVHYRGVKNAHLVGVLEGDGTEENPHIIVDYVLGVRNDGVLVTLGKLQPLTDKEKSFIGSDLTNIKQ